MPAEANNAIFRRFSYCSSFDTCWRFGLRWCEVCWCKTHLHVFWSINLPKSSRHKETQRFHGLLWLTLKDEDVSDPAVNSARTLFYSWHTTSVRHFQGSSQACVVQQRCDEESTRVWRPKRWLFSSGVRGGYYFFKILQQGPHRRHGFCPLAHWWLSEFQTIFL